MNPSFKQDCALRNSSKRVNMGVCMCVRLCACILAKGIMNEFYFIPPHLLLNIALLQKRLGQHLQ